MTAETENQGAADQGLAALVALLRFHGLGADPEQIRHSFGAKPIGVAEWQTRRRIAPFRSQVDQLPDGLMA